MVRPEPPSLRRCCVGSMSLSPAACAGMPPSPAPMPAHCPRRPNQQPPQRTLVGAKLHTSLRHQQVTSPNTTSRPPVLTKLGCTQLGNQTRLTHYVETRTVQGPRP